MQDTEVGTTSANALPNRQPTLRMLAMPTDTNASGDIFGGWIMSAVDIAGSIEARRRAEGRVVTVAVNSFHFKKPVFVGDLISCYASVERIGRSSLTVLVEVYAERTFVHQERGHQELVHQERGHRERGHIEVIKVTEASLTYVAIDSNGLPRAVET